MNLDSFFFLRPYWLLMLVPVIILIELYYRRTHHAERSAWHKLVDSHLLTHLTVKSRGNSQSRWIMAAPMAALIAVVFALAGPTWEKIELPAFKAQAPTVVVLSLAQSMNATDVSPSRLARAGHKVRDILERTKGGDLGFIIYADRPFVAAPLTSDTRVIMQMLPELSTSLMPVIGNNLNLAIDNAKQLLDGVDAHSGHIVIIADDAGMDSDGAITSAREARQAGYQVSVLGVGTPEGAAMQTASGQSIKTRSGQQAVTRLAVTELGAVADAGGGVFVTLTPDSKDIDTILQNTDGVPVNVQRTNTDFRSDAWNDVGYWLLIIPILLAPLAFRKNVLMALLPFGLVIGFTVPGSDAMAANLDNLWQTPDQQGAKAYQQGDFGDAAASFENPAWKAGALYKSGQYAEAAETYKNVATPDAYYNQGNALAKAGELKPALDAYDEALKQRPGDDDIQFNRDLVANLLEQQKQKEQKQQDQQQKDGDQDESQGGGEKSQDQSGNGQDQSQGEGDNNQEQSGNGQDESQGEGDKSQAQSGNEQDQSQGEGDKSQAQAQNQSQNAQEQKDSGSAANPSAGGQQGSEAEKAGEEQVAQGDSPDTGQASAKADNEDGKSAFQSAMDKLLKGNGQGQQSPEAPQSGQPPSAEGLSELDQAHEQQLRAVPDDPSGLLRARIRQYYSQLNRNG